MRRRILPLACLGRLHRRVTPGRFYFFPQLLPVNSDGSKLRMDATLLRAAVDAVEMTPVAWLEPVLLAPAEPEPLLALLAVRAPAPVVVDFPPAAELDPPDWYVFATALERPRSFSDDLLPVPGEADARVEDWGVFDPD